MNGEAAIRTDRTIRFFDAFCGIGGIRLGIERAAKRHGAQAVCVGSADIDEPARRAYSKRFGEGGGHVFHTDVRGVNTTSQSGFDVFLGGFPCQTFSSAGKRLGFMDQIKGTLFFECARIIQEFQPKAVLLENVKGLTTHDGGRTFATCAATLDQLGYAVEWQLINAGPLIPQGRERVYIVGHRRPLRPDWKPVFPFTVPQAEAFRARLAEEKRSQAGSGDTAGQPALQGGAEDYKGIVPFSSDNEGFGSRHIRSVGEVAATLVTTEGVGFIRNGKPYLATPVERERLMGFPDNWTDVEGNKYRDRVKQTGNAVCVPVIEMIMERLVPNVLA